VTPEFLFDYASWHDWRGWLGDHALRLFTIIGLLVASALAVRTVVSRALSSAITRAARVRYEDKDALERRADTLSATLNWAFRVLLVFFGLGLMLSEFGLNVSALIAGVGIVGIALGLGAQTLVKDVLNGMFILIEDQYSVGDNVTVAGVTGDVTEINPRRTVLRDADGNIHSVPNSAITVATNRTGSQNRFFVAVEVPFRESDEALRLVSEVCSEVAKDEAAAIISPPKVIAQRAVNGSVVVLKVQGDARPAARWQVEAELRRRLKRRFDAEQVEMEFSEAEPPK
jgi:small-conductance mechanosensitive channel